MMLVVCLLACTKEPSHTQNQPARQQPAPPAPVATTPGSAPATGSAADNDDPCPKRGGPQTTAVQRIGLYGRMYPHEQGHVWYSTKDFKVLQDNSEIDNANVKDVPRGFIAVSKPAWFVQRCDEKTGCGEHGDGRAIDRIDRSTQQTTKLAGPEKEIAFAEVYGGFLYWGTFGPYGASGELKRVPEAGGTIETLWSGAGVTQVLIKDAVAYVADGKSVTSIALATPSKPTLLAKDLTDARGLAVDDKFVYIVDRGKPYWDAEPSGFVLRVPRAGGTIEKLAGPVKWPTVVGVDPVRIYFMGDGWGDVWAIPKAGGKAAVFIPTPPRDWECRSTKWLEVTPRGIQYLRMSEGFDTKTGRPIDWGTLWSIRREWMMTDPVKQFADYMAKGSGATGSAALGSAALGSATDDR